jgi:hypothetical protein
MDLAGNERLAKEMAGKVALASHGLSFVRVLTG